MMGTVSTRPNPTLRVATIGDAPAIDALMKTSTAAIFPAHYDATQTASSVRHIARVDPDLLVDGTYFAIEADGELVACGGWSHRGRTYMGSADAPGDDRHLDPATEAAHIRAMFVRADWTRRGLGRAILTACNDAARAEGFTRLALMSTLPGVPLYKAFGFTEVESAQLPMPDGTMLAGVAMERPIEEKA